MIKDEPSARVKLGAAETPTWRNLWNRLSNNPSFLAVNDDIERDEESEHHQRAMFELLTDRFQSWTTCCLTGFDCIGQILYSGNLTAE